MPIVPIPITWWDAGWLAFRVAMQITFVVGFFLGLRHLSRHTKAVLKLLAVVQSRETILAELKVTATALAAKTDAVVAEQAARDHDLRRRVEENTDLTRAAATAAKDAFHVANDVNSKIARTNENIERALKPPPSDAAAEHLEQIDKNTAAIAENTKKG